MQWVWTTQVSVNCRQNLNDISKVNTLMKTPDKLCCKTKYNFSKCIQQSNKEIKKAI